MPDTTPDTPTCPRHTRRPADPVLCTGCVDEARTAIWRLPEQHRLLLGVRHATPARMDRNSAGGPPSSPNRWFDHADDIETTLMRWANDWAEHLGTAAPDGTLKRFGRDPGACARFLLDYRRGNPFAIPGAAEDLAADMLRLHRTAARLLGDVDPPAVSTRRRAAGPCPECGMCTLHRPTGSDRIRCDNCPASLSTEEYAAHARALVDAHRGAA